MFGFDFVATLERRRLPIQTRGAFYHSVPLLYNKAFWSAA